MLIVSVHREWRGWYAYDWAVSAFHTIVLSVFLGPYLTDVTQAAAGPDGFVHPAGLPVRAESFYPYVVSASVLVQVFVLPFVGSVADRIRRKKQFLAGLAYAGSLATMGLYFLSGDSYLLGGALFLFANVAVGASVVVSNSFLPQIAAPEDRDRVSSRGWAVGYLGGGLLLLANLIVFLRHEAFGLSQAEAVRVSLASAGVWWAVFTVVPLVMLRNRQPDPDHVRDGTPLRSDVRQLARTVKEARAYPRTLLFLAAYLLYNDGVQAVIALSSTYGAEALGLDQTVLIEAILMVQFVAFVGALLLGRLARTYGAKRVVLASLVVWAVLLVLAYLLRAGAVAQFFALAFGIGLVLGGTQALSRSMFSHLVPRGREAQYFVLYELGERGTTWLGTLAFGLALQVTGSYRAAIMSLLAFFVAGFVLLTRVDMRQAIRDVGNSAPTRV